MLAAVSIASPVGAFAAENYQTVKESNMVEYYGDYDALTYPYEGINANFTTDSITIDGKLEEAYNSSVVSRIDNVKTVDGYGLDSESTTYGELRTLWDGPVLYLGISVYDDSVMTSTDTNTGAVSNPAVAGKSETTYIKWGAWTFPVTTTKETCDSVAIAVDLFNDRTTYETDTAGIMVVDALGQSYYYSSSNIPSLGSALGDPTHPEYMNIIKGYAADKLYDEAGNQIGYTVEVGLQVEGVNPANGTQIGLDIKINDVNEIVTGYKTEQIPNPERIAAQNSGLPKEVTAEENVTADKTETVTSESADEVTESGVSENPATQEKSKEDNGTAENEKSESESENSQKKAGEKPEEAAEPGEADNVKVIEQSAGDEEVINSVDEPKNDTVNESNVNSDKTDDNKEEDDVEAENADSEKQNDIKANENSDGSPKTGEEKTTDGDTVYSKTLSGEGIDTPDRNANGTLPIVGESLQEMELPEFIEVKTPVKEVKKSANIFWSHDQDGLYGDFDHEHTNSVDWGVVTLCGKQEDNEFAYSEYRITKILDYMDSPSFQKGVYTEETQKALDDAVALARAYIDGTEKSSEKALEMAELLENAFYGLRWADTRYPDPADLKKEISLPNTYKFFGSDRVVENSEEWAERRKEILDLAQFYEYGYKPEYDGLEISKVETHRAGDVKYRWSNSQNRYVEDGTYTSSSVSITATVTVKDVSRDISFEVNIPSDDKIEASGHAGEKLPIVLSFDGAISSYTDAGIALITVPSVVSDTRTNSYAWGTRTGLFYDLYPYSRDGKEALNEVSNEMASAWAASVIIDALELCDSSADESINEATRGLAVDKLAVTGFSINGKYAFVSAVFDDRIDVCIPGAAGATGPSPWRYVYRGQEYDWSGTDYVNPDVESKQVAWGTEVLANSIRHNRVREIELFRHFLTPGHFYEFEKGAYGYGTGIPYDQNDLIATLAPRAIVIENTVNDYNDGCVSDCLGAEIAKSVYGNLGFAADDLIKFNLRNLKTGDPHGSDSEQRSRSAEYLNYFFFGKELSETTAKYLGTDPFGLNISNGQTMNPYDYYWGGYNTITGGTGGIDGRNGWYYYTFPVKRPDVPASEDEHSSETSDSSAEEENAPSLNTTQNRAVIPVALVVENAPVSQLRKNERGIAKAESDSLKAETTVEEQEPETDKKDTVEDTERTEETEKGNLLTENTEGETKNEIMESAADENSLPETTEAAGENNVVVIALIAGLLAVAAIAGILYMRTMAKKGNR